MATFVEFNLFETTGNHVDLYNTPAEAVAEADLEDDDECSVYLFINSAGEKLWGVRAGHDGWGVHETAGKARDAEDWFEDDWCYTTDAELATKLNG